MQVRLSLIEGYSRKGSGRQGPKDPKNIKWEQIIAHIWVNMHMFQKREKYFL